jgi:hypothetical protein
VQPLKSNKDLISGATPSKGILKKATSMLDMQERGISEFDIAAKRLENFLPNVVDIKKYLKSQQQEENGVMLDNDMWNNGERDNWRGSTVQQQQQQADTWSTAGTVLTQNSMRDPRSPPKSLTTAAPENEYMSDVASTSGDYRSGRDNEEMEQKRQVTVCIDQRTKASFSKTLCSAFAEEKLRDGKEEFPLQEILSQHGTRRRRWRGDEPGEARPLGAQQD